MNRAVEAGSDRDIRIGQEVTGCRFEDLIDPWLRGKWATFVLHLYLEPK